MNGEDRTAEAGGAPPRRAISIFNDVLGPVMRGPSSSHTAGSFHIASIARSLLGTTPRVARLAFDPEGSYGKVFAQQGVDRAFVAGLLGWRLEDARFSDALRLAPAFGLDVAFDVRPLAGASHPNTVEIVLEGDPAALHATARSIGGGAVELTRLDGWAVHVTGERHEVLVELGETAEGEVARVLADRSTSGDAELAWQRRAGLLLVHVTRARALSTPQLASLVAIPGVRRVRQVAPIAFVRQGRPLFDNAARMVALAGERGCSLGSLALAYEATLLGLTHQEVLDEMGRRFDVMRRSVELGLGEQPPAMQLLAPSAGAIMEADRAGRLAIGGLHTRAAARAMAVMHVNSGMGVVCAAPTGGSAGALPGVVVTLVAERGLDRTGASLALLAASAIGVALASRATFAAEVAGCQVEIGAAGAMAAAAVVEAAGGTARQAADAAAIAFQNTMGSVCDLVQGIVEIPCHTRNAVAASSAFVCADLVMGGYENPIPLDETIDAVYAVGRMLPVELRCTALGGLAVTPSALALTRRAPDSTQG
jgi:L-serine dehydratase